MTKMINKSGEKNKRTELFCWSIIGIMVSDSCSTIVAFLFVQQNHRIKIK